MTYQRKIPKKFRIIPKSIRFLRVAPKLVEFNSHNYSTIIHPTKTLQGNVFNASALCARLLYPGASRALLLGVCTRIRDGVRNTDHHQRL